MNSKITKSASKNKFHNHMVYISARFPSIRQSFEYHEVLELQKIHPVTVFSFRNAELIKGHKAHEELGHVANIKYFNGKQLANAFLIVIKYPRRALKSAFELTPLVVKSPQYAIKSFGCFLMGLSLSKLVIQNRVEHIHANFTGPPGTVAYVASSITGIPFSMKAHAGEIYTERKSNKDLLLRKKIQASAFTAFISIFGRDFIIRSCGLDNSTREKLVIVRCGIDIPRIEKAVERIKKEIPQDTTGTLRIVSCGGLVPKKGFHILIGACLELSRRGMRIQCDIFGDGPQDNFLKTQAKSMPCPILFHGAYRQEDLPRILANADVFVLACIVDPFTKDMDGIPVALMEAMAAKVPVISTRLSGIPELIEHEQTGLLAEPGSINDLANCIEHLSNDQALRKRLMTAAYLRVIKEYGRQVNAQRLWALIQTTLTAQK